MLLICTMAPRPCAAHLRQYRASQRGGAEDVQVEQIAQLAVGGLLDGADLSAARIVDQYVDPPVPRDHIGDRGIDPRRCR